MKNKNKKLKSKKSSRFITDFAYKGFTLLEILLVVAIIAILAAVVIGAINPNKQLGDARNSQRRADVNTISEAVYQYIVDNNGAVPTVIPVSNDCAGVAANEICKTDGTCTGLVDISFVATDQKYLVSIPTDPIGESTNGAGYHIVRNDYDRIEVCAPDAEQSISINLIR